MKLSKQEAEALAAVRASIASRTSTQENAPPDSYRTRSSSTRQNSGHPKVQIALLKVDFSHEQGMVSVEFVQFL